MQPQALPGFRDFYPADFALRAHIFDTWRKVAQRYGFEEYDGPPLEPLELYTAKSGSEIVAQLYNFQDKGDRAVALRPEMTPTLARMVAARANGLKKPIRWFSIPQLFRYERQQRGRLREHFQLNCDLIGEAGPLGDAEIIALAVDVLRAFGLTAQDFRVRLSDRRLVQAVVAELELNEAQSTVLFQVLDKVARTPEDVSIAKLVAAGFQRSAIDRILALGRPQAWDGLQERVSQRESVRSALRPLLAAQNALDAMGLGDFAQFDFSIVRGIAYYTGTVFELFDARGELRAICGGGRYDDLLQTLGGVDLPALGFGMGDVVLGELLKERGLVPGDHSSIDVFVARVEDADEPHTLRLVHTLRDAGLRVEYALSPMALGKQFRLADTRHARFVVVAGADERARGEVMLKDLAAKSQRPVPEAEVGGLIRAAVGPAEVR